MAMTPEERRQRRNEQARQWRAANPEKVRANLARWRAANPEQMREQHRRWRAANPEKLVGRNARWSHGLQPEDKAEIYEAQAGRCYLCGDLLPADPDKWAIDHDHRCCGKKRSCRYCRRGIACNHCNTLIGLAFDDPERLRRIAGNLEAVIADVTRRLAGKAVQAELFELGETDKVS